MNAARRGLNPQPGTAALRSAGVIACGLSGRPARSSQNTTLPMASPHANGQSQTSHGFIAVLPRRHIKSVSAPVCGSSIASSQKKQFSHRGTQMDTDCEQRAGIGASTQKVMFSKSISIRVHLCPSVARFRYRSWMIFFGAVLQIGRAYSAAGAKSDAG